VYGANARKPYHLNFEIKAMPEAKDGITRKRETKKQGIPAEQ
jgi:hypothetical protein